MRLGGIQPIAGALKNRQCFLDQRLCCPPLPQFLSYPGLEPIDVGAIRSVGQGLQISPGLVEVGERLLESAPPDGKHSQIVLGLHQHEEIARFHKGGISLSVTSLRPLEVAQQLEGHALVMLHSCDFKWPLHLPIMRQGNVVFAECILELPRHGVNLGQIHGQVGLSAGKVGFIVVRSNPPGDGNSLRNAAQGTQDVNLNSAR